MSRLTVTLPSPKSAAESASVYRRRRMERPRERWLRVLGLVGALVVHLLFLVSMILGSAYDIEEVDESTPPLVVALWWHAAVHQCGAVLLGTCHHGCQRPGRHTCESVFSAGRQQPGSFARWLLSLAGS